MKEYKYKINGIKFTVGVGDVTDNEVYVEVNGTPYHVELDKAPEIKAPKIEKPKNAEEAPRTEAGEKVVAKPVIASKAAAVKSPLPGTVMSFAVKVGDSVKAGDTVCVLEAMKMENDIHTIKGGVVKEILCKVGDSVLEGTDLMIIE
ncbi:MAG: biotin/lipoyl-binding protein [Muribaculaceae bacterium]|nr:biotin/lipoyl-binding protein [Muribaculaceae bacterium]